MLMEKDGPTSPTSDEAGPGARIDAQPRTVPEHNSAVYYSTRQPISAKFFFKAIRST